MLFSREKRSQAQIIVFCSEYFDQGLNLNIIIYRVVTVGPFPSLCYLKAVLSGSIEAPFKSL